MGFQDEHEKEETYSKRGKKTRTWSHLQSQQSNPLGAEAQWSQIQGLDTKSLDPTILPIKSKTLQLH